MKFIFLLLTTVTLFATAHTTTLALNKARAIVPVIINETAVADSTTCLNDTQFLISAYDAGIFEVKASRLARRMTGDRKVRQFAVMVHTCQENTSKDLLALLTVKGCVPPAQLPADLKNKFVYLNEWMGNDFNRKYTTSNIAAQKATIALYTAIGANSPDADIRSFAVNALPGLQMQEDSAEHLLIHINRPHTSSW